MNSGVKPIMKALVYDAPRRYSIKEVPRPQIHDNQVLIKVKVCGICKTDLHIHNGEFISSFPLTPGHEFAGEIVQIGSNVTDLNVGDRVVADNTVLCGHCYYCRRNQPLFCENFYSLGCNGPGGFAEFVAANHDKVFRISDRLTFEEAAFTEPTACAIHGMDVIDIHPGDDVLLFGAGPTGLILCQLARACGTANLVVAGPTLNKLNLAKEWGADEIIQIDRDNPNRHRAAIEALFPQGFDVIIDATGAASITEESLRYAKFGAKIIVYGVCDEKDTIKLSPYDIFRRELKIFGSFAQTHCFDRALKYLEHRRVKVDRLVTHVFGLEDYGKAMEVLTSRHEAIKVLIKPDLPSTSAMQTVAESEMAAVTGKELKK
jgi:D-arabinitol dehydrogenase (NADP+)